MKKLPEVDISIVNYNGGGVIINCLKSIFSLRDSVKVRVWVVDNDSRDDSANVIEREFKQVTLVRNRANVGFAKAHNQVLKQVEGEYVLVLNPDTVLTSGVLDELVGYLQDHPDVGAITPKVVFENGRVDLTAHRGFPKPWAAFRYYVFGNDDLYHLRSRFSNTAHQVDSISGAFFMTTKHVLDQVGLFDEDFFMYAEDIDICLRMCGVGYKVIYYPGVSVIHYKGISSGIKSHSTEQASALVEDKKRALNSFYETMWLFYEKHYNSKYPFVVGWLVWLGIHLKWFMAKRKMVV